MIIPLPSHSPSSPTSAPNRVGVIPDKRAIAGLVNTIITRTGLKQTEVAERMGLTKQSIFNYYAGHRTSPSLFWFSRFVEACGGKVYVEFPDR
jgi:hypothetical protein